MKNIENFIGNTPLAEIVFNYKGEKKRLFAKLEYYNLTGSIKDRMAYNILKNAYETGKIKPGDTIAEATSGNTGIAFCALGAMLNHPVKIYMPNWMSQERINLIEGFGAEVRLVSPEEGGFLGSIDLAEKFADENDNVFLPKQFENIDNPLAQYNSLGKEIVENFKNIDLIPDGFVAGVGTGGTVMGVSKALKEINPDSKSFPLEPLESPTLSTGDQVGHHRVAGISDEFVPDILKLDQLDDIISVSDGDAIIMAQKLSRSGLGVGVSSGANFIGAIKAMELLGEDSIVVTVFPDDNKKYLSTDLFKIEPVKDFHLSKDVEILDIISHRF